MIIAGIIAMIDNTIPMAIDFPTEVSTTPESLAIFRKYGYMYAY